MMRLLVSIPLALVGSLFGSALRSALNAADERLDADPDAPAADMSINVSGSLLAGAAGGVAGILFGSGTAFWTGLALGAAGIERFDFRLLRVAGVDVDAMIARARSVAEQRTAASPAQTDSEVMAIELDAEGAELEAELGGDLPAAEPA